MLRVLQARLQQYMHRKLPNVQVGFRKGKGTRDQIANIRWIIGKAREFIRKHLLLLHRLCLSLVWIYKQTVLWITANCGKFLKRWEYQITLSVCWETCIWVKKQQSETYMERLIGSKLGRVYDKAVYHHPACLTSMQSTSCEMPGWMKHKLESRLPGEISITSDTQMTPPL